MIWLLTNKKVTKILSTLHVALLSFYLEHVSSMFWSYPVQKCAYTRFTNKNTDFKKYQY